MLHANNVYDDYDDYYDNDNDDYVYDNNDGYPMVGDHVVASGHRETTALKLIVIYVTEIQNKGKC